MSGVGKGRGMSTGSEARASAQPSVLLVGCTDDDGRLLERAFAADGISTAATDDPRTVAGLVRSDPPDLILLELDMPVMDGFQVLERLHGVIRDDDLVPVVALSSDATSATRNRALAAGAADVVSRPYERSELVLRVRNLLRTRSLYVAQQQRTEALEAQVQREGRDRHARSDQTRKRATRIQAVLRGDGMQMHYQPIVAVGDGELLGAEALARFDAKPVRAPHRWFAEAEQVGLGVQLEVAAVRAAARGLEQLPGSCYLSVNVSAAAVKAPGGFDALRELPPHRLVVELTEHVRVDDYDGLAAALAPLRAAGVRLAVDDTGEGFTKLRHIGRLEPQIVKMARPLTQGLDAEPAQRAQTAALVRFAREIGATTVAEGVETTGELAALSDLGVDAAQGYLFGRPQPLPLRPQTQGFTL